MKQSPHLLLSFVALIFIPCLSMAEVRTYQLSATGDDAFCSSSGNWPSTTTVYWPWAGSDRMSFLRWSVDVPAGATILSAKVRVKAHASSPNTTTAEMQMVDSDNCSGFTANPWTRPVTGPVSNWAMPALTAEQWYESPDIKEIVQSFVNRPGYVPSNSLGLRARKLSGSSTHKVIRAWDYGTHESGAQLVVDFSSQGTLSYAYGPDNNTYNFRPLTITASHNGISQWQLTVRVPKAGLLQTSHNYYLAGEIIGFQDLAFGGTPFEYSPETDSVQSTGLMKMGTMQGSFLDGTDTADHSGQTSAYYEFQKTVTLATGVTGLLTTRINAPQDLGGGNYETVIDSTCTVTNNSGAAYSLIDAASFAGTGALALARGGLSGTFVNPTASTQKPNRHVTESTDGHRLYDIYDWFGSTVTSGIPGFFAKQVVKNNSDTVAKNMRPGMTFELRSDAIDLSYSDLADTMYGSTAAGTSGVRCSINQPRVFGSGTLPDGQSVTLNWQGVISTLPYTNEPMANAGPDQELYNTGTDTTEPVTLDGSASYDSDGSIASWVWKENGVVIATGQTAQPSLSLGDHNITLEVTDNAGAKDEDTVFVRVKYQGPFYVSSSAPGASDSNLGTQDAPWKTIGYAVSQAIAGQTVSVQSGTYSESLTLTKSGTEGAPIVIQAAGGAKPVITGADPIVGWTSLGITSRNPNGANIYFADIAWNPTALHENNNDLEIARTPDDGYWTPEIGSDQTHIVNSNLDSSSGCVGATMFYASRSPVTQSRVKVTGYNPTTTTLTMASSVMNGLADLPTPGEDVFYLYNKLEFIDAPGQWASEDLGGGVWRVYVWPSGGGDANNYAYESPRRTNYVVSTNGRSNIVLDGFEIRDGVDSGVYINGGSGIRLKNCVIYGNGYKGVLITGASGVDVRNSIMVSNNYGITVHSSANVTVEKNEIAWNNVDAINLSGITSLPSTNLHFRNNYIHDHFLWGHPDGFQTFNADSSTNPAVLGLWIENNAVIHSGQSFIFAEAQDIHLINNLIVGGGANTFKSGGKDYTYLNNTVCYSGSTMLAFYSTSTGCVMKNNIFFQGHGNIVLNIATDTLNSDYNLIRGDTGHFIDYLGTYYNSLSSYSLASGKDLHSQGGDPLFVNAPAFFTSCDSSKLPQFTTSRIYVNDAVFSVGDHLEYNYDGVVRSVTNVGAGGLVEFAPSLTAMPVVAGVAFNWKANTNYSCDFALSAGSPAIGTGQANDNMGSNVNLLQFEQGDFDNDGIRDIPIWP